MSRFHLFHHQIQLSKIDPLDSEGDDAISAEQQEPEHIDLKEQYDPELASRWDKIVRDVRKDPGWFDFSEE
ncbi:hypothetical protein KBD87_02100 [Candidatus Saccharibacteria bacterium]|nr:hypothetical protein [Candidatus Saccharibacteria bacterium]